MDRRHPMSVARSSVPVRRETHMSITISTARFAPHLETTVRERLLPVSENTWRVIATDGRVLGQIRAVPSAAGTRFQARRFDAAVAGFREVGEFWSPDEACDCLRWM